MRKAEFPRIEIEGQALIGPSGEDCIYEVPDYADVTIETTHLTFIKDQFILLSGDSLLIERISENQIAVVNVDGRIFFENITIVISKKSSWQLLKEAFWVSSLGKILSRLSDFWVIS
jgi:hypothetical protein